MPKAELHVHLEGAVGAERIAAWARTSRRPPPWALAGPDRVRRTLARIRSMADFLRVYVGVMRLFDRAERFAEAVEDLAARFGEAGFVRLEVTVTAAAHVALWGLPAGALLEGLLEGRRRAAAHGVSVAFVPDAVRTLPRTVAPTLAFAEALAAADRGALAGVGLAGDERGSSRETEAALLGPGGLRDRLPGVPLLPHAGEFGPAAGVRRAIEVGRAPRVGHGIAVVRDPATVALARARRTVFEVCPDSNVRLGAVSSAAAHPLRAMIRAGLRVVLATDDPGIFDLDPLASYRFALRAGCSPADLVRCAATSLRAATGP